MKIDGWRCYRHMAVPTIAPHLPIDPTPIKNGNIWNISGGSKPYLVRWITDFDCKKQTDWWYVIKDNPFDISKIKSKRRYEINKGIKNFCVKEIDHITFCDGIYNVANKAYEKYPAAYRPNICYDAFVEDVKKWNHYKVYGAFSNDSGELCSYAILDKNDLYIDFVNLKSVPESEKNGVNFAIIYKILVDHEAFLKSGGYICDGSRAINHVTNFQDFLEKYFEFRKAYCELHIKIKPTIRNILIALYLFKGILYKLDRISFIHNINSVLKLLEFSKQY